MVFDGWGLTNSWPCLDQILPLRPKVLWTVSALGLALIAATRTFNGEYNQLAVAGNCKIFRSPPSTSVRTWSAHNARAARTSSLYDERL